jgi:hypothetical protein
VRRIGWALLLVTAGCGRLSFDELTDSGGPCLAAIGHDEDHDGVDDACDGCPHIADALQSNSDGDGVNDACDPNPVSPREHIFFFDPFIAAGSSWSVEGGLTETYANDSMLLDTRGGYLFLRRLGPLPAFDVLEFGGAVGGRAGPESKIQTSLFSSAVPYYYCELYDTTATVNFDLAWTYNGTQYFTSSIMTMQTPLVDDSLTLTTILAPPNVTCRTSWPPAGNTTNPIPAGIDAIGYGLQVYGLEIRLDYFVQIRTE